MIISINSLNLRNNKKYLQTGFKIRSISITLHDTTSSVAIINSEDDILYQVWKLKFLKNNMYKIWKISNFLKNY